jgi:hypothetical protein
MEADSSQISSTSPIQPTFFGETSALIPKSKVENNGWIYVRTGINNSEKIMRIVKCIGIPLATLTTLGLVFMEADTAWDMANAPPGSSQFYLDAAILGLGGVLFGAASCVSLTTYCIFKQMRKAIESKYPHYTYYQGMPFTPVSYIVWQDSSKDEEICRPLIEGFFQDLKEKKLLDLWLNYKGYANLDIATSKTFKKMTKGTCYGYSMALASEMLKNCGASSAELINNITFEKVYYYQFMHHIIVNLIKKSTELNKDDFYKIIEQRFTSDEDLIFHWLEDEGYAKWNTSYDYLFLLLQNVDFKNILFHQLNLTYLSSVDNDGAIEAFFNKGKLHIELENECKDKPKELTIAGTVTLYSDPEKKEQKIAGHALFFQFSEGHYRFHDSGSRLTGFFEFPTKELFFANLIEHVKTWSLFKDGLLRFTFLGIPKENPSDEIAITINDVEE